MNEQESHIFLNEKIKNILEAPSCCPELKEVAEAYLKAVGTEKEAEAKATLFAELECDVLSIDTVHEFICSEMGKELFGAEMAQTLAKKAEEVKAQGGDTCFCPACTAGKEILEEKSELL